MFKLPLRATLLAHGSHKFPLRIKNKSSVIRSIRHIHLAIRTDSDASRVERPIRNSCGTSSPSAQEKTVRIENLDLSVGIIRNIEIPIRTNSDIIGIAKLPRATSRKFLGQIPTILWHALCTDWLAGKKEKRCSKQKKRHCRRNKKNMRTGFHS